MSLESVTRISEITGFDRRTIKARLSAMKPVKEGRSHLYETRDALRLLYLESEKAVYDLQEERARLAHHQANMEKIKEDEARAMTIPTDLVIRLCSENNSAARTKLLSVPSQVKTKHGRLEQSVINDIEKYIHDALWELADDGIPPGLQQRMERYQKELATTSEADD